MPYSATLLVLPLLYWMYCRQAVPIPSYLLALAVGNLESRELGPISAVWSEPEMVEAGAYEFAGGWVPVALQTHTADQELTGPFAASSFPPSGYAPRLLCRDLALALPWPL
jgi:hypothetical protein